MSEAKHTPLPWYEGKPNMADQTALYCDAEQNAIAIIYEGPRNADLIVRAVNAYERDQETIRALVEALQDAHNLLSLYASTVPNHGVESVRVLRQAEAALARRGKENDNDTLED